MTHRRTTRIVGFAGSLRTDSYNRALLREAQRRTPPSMELHMLEVGELPMFDADLEEGGLPESVVDFNRFIREADGLLIVTPEYNFGVPAVTKNAVDWASRSPDDVLADLPVALAGASPGMTGTARAQSSLRRSLQAVGAYAMPQPEILVARAHEKFEDGRLVDTETGEFLESALARFQGWIDRLAIEDSGPR